MEHRNTGTHRRLTKRWMLQSFVLLLFMVNHPISFAQNNLVPNGGFEQFTNCPNANSDIDKVHNWYSPTPATPDYYHVCGLSIINQEDTIPIAGVPDNRYGWQNPKEGDAYIGIYAYQQPFPDGREYVQVELTETIHSRIRYRVQFYVSLGEESSYGISSMGMHFSIDPLIMNDYDPINVTPQILHDSNNPILESTDWVLITDTFTSSEGGEKFITIANFMSDAESDTVFFNPEPSFNNRHAYYYVDDVSVIALDSIPNSIKEADELSFELWPNPTTETLNIKSKRGLVELRLLDMRGRNVLTENVSGNTLALDIKSIHAGIYILEITDSEGRRATERFIKSAVP